MLDLLSDDMRRDPFALYDQLRAASPVLHVPAFDAWMVFDYESVRRVLTDHETFSSSIRHQSGRAFDWLIFLDPPRHTKLRAIVSRAFTARSIAALEPRIRDLACALLDEAAAHGDVVDLVSSYAGALPTLVIAEMLGVPLADRPRLVRWADALANLIYAIAGGDRAARAMHEYAEARAEMQPYVAAQLAARRTSPGDDRGDDLLGRLVAAEVDGERLNDDEILGFFQLLLSAGSETTTHLIDNAVLCLDEHPAERARLRANPALLASAIEEVLRFRSPASVMFRQTTRAVTLHGHTIPADRFVLAMIGSANRDPAQFADPHRFDIARTPNPHIAFGHGMHFCLGAPLARLEGRVALEELWQRFPDVERADHGPWEPRKALHVHGPARLPVRLR